MNRHARRSLVHHGRRFAPFYALGVAWLLMIVVVPTTAPPVGPGSGFTGALSREAPSAGPATGQPDVNGFTGTAAGPNGAGPSGTTPSGGGGTTPGAGGGTTRAGVVCSPGVRQLPESAYAAPCLPAWTGDNGGATWRGVSRDTIKVVSRDYSANPTSEAAESIILRAGQAPQDVVEQVRQVFLDHFNSVYELYGRKVVIEQFRSRADINSEIQNEGREQACADATEIAEERKAFAVLPSAGGIGFGPFSECSAERGLMVPIGPYGFPESWYRQYHPYAWGVQMSCDRINYQVPEYIAKRLAGRPARWAREEEFKSQTRRFGMIAPDLGAYRECVELFVNELKRQGVEIISRFNYTPDPATYAQQAVQAVVQFNADKVTTLVLLSDFLVNINLTEQASSQGWGPEWVIQGVGFQDFDNFTRLYNQSVVDGHLFGMSELGATGDIQGPEGEPAKLYKRLTGTDMPSGTDGDYFTLVHLFNLLQSAGPVLTPDAVAEGAASLPEGGPPARAVGLWSFTSAGDGTPGVLEHTAVDDAREVYWDGSATGYDGNRGTYVATYGGRRFGNGEWPAEEPAVYPSG